MNSVAVGPYSTRLTSLYVLLLADAAINANADANATRFTQVSAVLALAGQVITRLGAMAATVGLLGTSGQWRDDFLLEFCGLFAVSLIGMIVCLFLRVYRVTLASYPSNFDSVVDYWHHPEYGALYCAMLVVHIVLSLLYYYYSIRAAYRMGSSRHAAESAARTFAANPGSTPTVYGAVSLASMRR